MQNVVKSWLAFFVVDIPLYHSRSIHAKSRTTKITLNSVIRGKITIMLKIKKLSKPFNKDKSVRQ